MSVNVKEKPANFVIFNFFGHNNFHHPLPPPSQSRIRGDCDCDRGILDNKNHCRKNQNQIFKNVGRRHNIANSRVLQLRWEKLRDKNCGWKNWTDIPIFQLRFSSSNFPPSQSQDLEFAILCRPTFLRIYPSQAQDPRIRDVASSSNSFENFKFSKLSMEEIGWQKSQPKKLKKVGLIFSIAIFITQPPTHSPPPSPIIIILAWPSRWVKKIAPKNRKRQFDFFGRDFCHYPLPPHCNCHRTL